MPNVHPALWMIQQLHKGIVEPNWSINVRAIHNKQPYFKDGKEQKETKVTFNEFIPLDKFEKVWNGGLVQNLNALNTNTAEPSNIYFGVNPRISRGNKPENVAGYTSFYLDLDDNKSYTKEERLIQLQFWTDCGLTPSMVVDSGHGYHAYWVLNRRFDSVEGQQILKSMVLMSGCRDKGNTHDVTRILRLPGFYNQKNWFESDSPLCKLINPTETEYENVTLKRFDPLTFKTHFPPSEKEDISHYHALIEQSGENIHTVIKQAAAIAAKKTQETAYGVGQEMCADTQDLKSTYDHAAAMAALPGAETKVKVWSPTKDLVPLLNDIAFDRKHVVWLRKYCAKGHEGLTEKDLEKIKSVSGSEDISSSELDFRVMYHLIKMGYTEKAITEFWNRPEHKLYRADKMQKNANYLRMTFEKALSFVRSALASESKDSKSAKTSEIIVSARHTLLVKGNGASEIVCTGDLELLAKYWDEDGTSRMESEWFEILCKCFNGNSQPVDRTLLLPAKAFSSLGNFKELVCGQHLRCFTSEPSALQKLLSYLEMKYPNAPVHTFHTKVVYKDKKFVFPKYTVCKDELKMREEINLGDVFTKRYFNYAWFKASFMEPEELPRFFKENWKYVTRSHLPRLVGSIIGIIGASAIKPIFEQELKIEDFHIPTVNVTGASHSGKTETVKRLMRLCGVVGGKNSISTNSSQFSISMTLGSTNFVPITIDEYKLTEDHSNARSLENIREIVRKSYSGETMLRGRADLSVTAITLHTGLVVLGEHSIARVGDVSEISRVIPITTDEYVVNDNYSNYEKFEALPLHEVAPLFYHFLLSQNAESWYRYFKECKTKIAEDLASAYSSERIRVAHNIAVLWLGCALYGAFVKSYWPECPDLVTELDLQENLVNYMKRYTIETSQSIIYENDPVEAAMNSTTAVVKPGYTVLANNEVFRLIQAFNKIREMRDRVYMDMIERSTFTHAENLKSNYIRIKISAIYDCVLQFNQNRRTSLPPEAKIHQMIKGAFARGETWIKNIEVYEMYNGVQHKCIEVDLKQLVKMKLWNQPATQNPTFPKLTNGNVGPEKLMA